MKKLTLLLVIGLAPFASYAKPYKSRARKQPSSTQQVYLSKLTASKKQYDVAAASLMDLARKDRASRGMGDVAPSLSGSLQSLVPPPTTAQWLVAIGKTRAAITTMRNISPVPYSMSSVDQQFEQGSIQVESGLDVFKQWVYSRDNNQLSQAANFFRAAQPFFDKGSQMAFRAQELKASPKTYVPG